MGIMEAFFSEKLQCHFPVPFLSLFFLPFGVQSSFWPKSMIFFFETVFYYVDSTDWLMSQRTVCLCIWSTENKDFCHQAWPCYPFSTAYSISRPTPSWGKTVLLCFDLNVVAPYLLWGPPGIQDPKSYDHEIENRKSVWLLVLSGGLQEVTGFGH